MNDLSSGKPVKDMTVTECKAYCAEFRRLYEYACETKGCMLAERHICYDYVSEWDDAKTPLLTNAELEICEVLGAEYVTRNDSGMDPNWTVKLWRRKPVKAYGRWENKFDLDPDYLGDIRASCFPSVKFGGIVKVHEEEGDPDRDKKDDR